MSKIKVHTEHRANHNPDNGPIGWRGFTASFSEADTYTHLRGCPLGRGASVWGAVEDLLQRARSESGVKWTRDDVEVVTWACHRCGTQGAHTPECEAEQKKG